MSGQEAFDACPKCGARLVPNAGRCLACGELESRERAPRGAMVGGSRRGGGGVGGINLASVLVVVLCVFGGTTIVSMAVCGSRVKEASDNMENFKPSDINFTASITQCVSPDRRQEIAQLLEAGFQEIDEVDGNRCFKKVD